MKTYRVEVNGKEYMVRHVNYNMTAIVNMGARLRKVWHKCIYNGRNAYCIL